MKGLATSATEMQVDHIGPYRVSEYVQSWHVKPAYVRLLPAEVWHAA